MITDAFIHTLHADMAITTTDLKPSVYPSTFDTSLRYYLNTVTGCYKKPLWAAAPTRPMCLCEEGSACFASCFPTEQPPRAHKAVAAIVELSGWNQPST